MGNFLDFIGKKLKNELTVIIVKFLKRIYFLSFQNNSFE